MRRWIWLAVVPVFFIANVRAEDWPGWLGPHRDGIWREQGLRDSLPKEGLKVRWRAPVGLGYAGPAVANGKIYLLDRQLKTGAAAPKDPFERGKGIPGTERVLCFDDATGKQLWAHEYDCPYTISYASGPRTTPFVDGDRVYTYGAEGHLHFLDANTGKVIWGGKRVSEHDTPMWGYAGHPLVDGDLVYVPVADPKGILYAINKKTGERVWQAIPTKECGYSPPVIRESNGKRQLIQWYPAGVTSLDPATGKVYWTVAQEPMEFGVAIVTPQLMRDDKNGDLLFVSSQYGGSVMIRLGKDAAGNPTGTLLYHRVMKGKRGSDAIQTLMATPVLRDGYVYGLDARGQLRCLVAATGDRVWESTAVTTYDEEPVSWATAFLTPLGDTSGRTLFANEHGDLILGELSPAAFKELGKAHLIDPTNTDAHRPVLWSHPAYANKNIYWRNDKELVSWSFAKE